MSLNKVINRLFLLMKKCLFCFHFIWPLPVCGNIELLYSILHASNFPLCSLNCYSYVSFFPSLPHKIGIIYNILPFLISLPTTHLNSFNYSEILQICIFQYKSLHQALVDFIIKYPYLFGYHLITTNLSFLLNKPHHLLDSEVPSFSCLPNNNRDLRHL